MKIALDTNFLIYAVMYRIDIFREFAGDELFVTSSIINELRGVSKGKGKESAAARVALELIKKNKVNVIKTDKNADNSLIELSKKGYSVATLDNELQKKVKKNNVKIFIIRQKKLVREL